MPITFGKAPATNRFPEGGVRIHFSCSTPWVVGVPLTSLQTVNGPLTTSMSSAVSLTSGLNGIPIDLSYVGLLSDNSGFIDSNSVAGFGYSLFPQGFRNYCFQFTHGLVRKLNVTAETEQATTKDGQLAIGYIRDPVTIAASSSATTLAGYLYTKQVSNLPGSVVFSDLGECHHQLYFRT